MTVFEECIQSLGTETKIFDVSQTSELRKRLFSSFNFGFSSIDWKSYPNFDNIESAIELISKLGNLDCYVFWDEYDTPAIKSELSKVIANIDDVSAVAFDTWIVGIDFDWVVEFYHEGEIRFLKVVK